MMMNKEADPFQYRRMTIEDIPIIMEIEVASFSIPWKEEAFYNELLSNHFSYYLVATYEDRVIGYCGVWIIIDEAHITNVAVHPNFRGQKVGESLLTQMMALSLSYGATKMTLEVRVSNIHAQKLYEKLGFVKKGLRKGYYTDNHEDAIVMWVDLQ
jgi:ribosomal-protein-alanine N-acetyltransferase